MGFLDKLFGRKKSPSSTSGAGGSIASALVQQGDQLSSGTCGSCGMTTVLPGVRVWVFSVREPEMSLDVGGYCPRCRKTLCPRHLSYALKRPSHMPRPDEFKSSSFAIVCESCGTQVEASRDGSSGDLTLVSIDMKDLEPRKPKPRKELQGASGRFSLLKVLEGSMRDAGVAQQIPRLICTRCLALHANVSPPIALGIDAFRKSGMDVSPADFDVDIGGNCPICGVICGKHAEIRLITMNGTECLALHCTEHDCRLE
jgi:hypothetical protein